MKKSLAVLLALSSMKAIGGDALSGNLSKIHFLTNGVVMAYTDGTRSNVPACAVQSSRFAIDATTPGGKVQLSGLLAAYAAGKPVRIVGTGTCSAAGDTETVSYFYTAD